ncbi:hypothetical protein IVB02_14465 [Bradyrhizobium sp. 166]|uniref:hypothetical protein n=1 Tax=Bradyrhizobium sp. 166 TaxID=2782638 RepID=UPI001FFA45F2|nr:hypothetical protein [Bradyrhizobium sp. 166]MCK1602616.1 hypothetical protein [Bradyrhizobium sp. 166]
MIIDDGSGIPGRRSAVGKDRQVDACGNESVLLDARDGLLVHHVRQEPSANLQCADEHEARERAQQLVDVNAIELWQLDRRIAVFEAALTVLHVGAVQDHKARVHPPCLLIIDVADYAT